ncbi:MgtC/SapB family protein [Agromyces sp. NPDC056965]|uniref:MgtC/SapB family protein n=1 Tax=Agromyces sp. NPDC056965 TaxID=3345983 RepID=UPI00362AC570
MWDLTSEAALATFEMLGLAFVLCALIGLERQFRQKSAGLRTHTLVGLGSAVFTLISAYGFASVVDVDVVVDPSRIAAQVVSGIGFLGAGVIFVRKDAVRGLTTAATIWVSAAVGMACGAGMPILAITATVLNMTAQFVLTRFGRLFTPGDSRRIAELRYEPGSGVLGDIFGVAAMHGFSASVIASDATVPAQDTGVLLVLALEGRADSGRLVAGIADVPGVLAVRLLDDDDDL